MKRLVAVLILLVFCLSSPLAALASNRHAGSSSVPPPQELPVTPPATGPTVDDGQDECGTLGDPDELGGGFRGGLAPPSFAGSTANAARWIDLWFMLMDLTR